MNHSAATFGKNCCGTTVLMDSNKNADGDEYRCICREVLKTSASKCGQSNGTCGVDASDSSLRIRASYARPALRTEINQIQPMPSASRVWWFLLHVKKLFGKVTRLRELLVPVVKTARAIAIGAWLCAWSVQGLLKQNSKDVFSDIEEAKAAPYSSLQCAVQNRSIPLASSGSKLGWYTWLLSSLCTQSSEVVMQVESAGKTYLQAIEKKWVCAPECCTCYAAQCSRETGHLEDVSYNPLSVLANFMSSSDRSRKVFRFNIKCGIPGTTNIDQDTANHLL
eukprot:1952963-Amphidinium_carterae.2